MKTPALQIIPEHAWHFGKIGDGTKFVITDEIIKLVLKEHSSISGTIEDCYLDNGEQFYTVVWDCGCTIEVLENMLEDYTNGN